MLDKIKNFTLIFSIPLLLIRYCAATILVLLNIWLGSGIAGILQGTMGLDYSETFVVTLAGSLILLMIPGMQKGYAESNGKMTDIESFKIKVAWAMGLGLYLFASLYALYGVYDVIETKNGVYTYMSFDWFGLVKPYEITKTLTWVVATFMFGKVFFAGGIDYIAGSLMEKDTSKMFNDEIPKAGLNGGINDKSDMQNKREFDTLYDKAISIVMDDKKNYDKVYSHCQTLSNIVGKINDISTKKDLQTKVTDLRQKCKDWKDQSDLNP